MFRDACGVRTRRNMGAGGAFRRAYYDPICCGSIPLRLRD